MVEGQPPRARKQFLRTRVEDLIAFPGPLLEKPWSRELPREKLFELAAATILRAQARAKSCAQSRAVSELIVHEGRDGWLVRRGNEFRHHPL